MKKETLCQYIDTQQKDFIKLSDAVWANPETRFVEYHSAQILQKFLEEQGFTVEKKLGGIETAFSGSFGHGFPTIALLGEFDALSGLSQKSGALTPEPVQVCGSGHGCGHNLLGTASLAAAVALKKYLEATKSSGTVIYYGCPGEEGGSGKTFMARENVFAPADTALTWHPQAYNCVYSMRTLANIQARFKFHGISSHAGVSPHLGRSALDAVELMNVGANYLREHIIPEARLHYAVTNTGGISPNVVQAEAEVLYLMRAPNMKQVQDIYQRVCNIAKGAALMTGTSVDIRFEKACSDYIPNEILEKVMYDNLTSIGAPHWSDKDLETAQAFQKTFSTADIENELSTVHKMMKKKSRKLDDALKSSSLSSVIIPYTYDAGLQTGSTDVGDVSRLMPTVQLNIACFAFGTPGHSWQLVSQGKLPAAHKGMLTAAKVLALTAADILQNPQIAEKAKKEYEQTLDTEKYVCPIPQGIRPSLA